MSKVQSTRSEAKRSFAKEGPKSKGARFMERAFELAERGRYTVSPNPMVGAVLVANGRIVGEGWHRRAGGPHAEIAALAAAGRRARGADLYVTLEPCVHHGRTPPCTKALAAAGVRRVVYAARDPNPLVAGRGARALRRAGLAVNAGTPADRARARRQNERFFVSILRRRPFVLAKWAAALDGKIASASGQSRWITGAGARRKAMLLREEMDAVLVGAGTVKADDPRLTRRLGVNRATPHCRIVLDGRLLTPENAGLFRRPAGVIVATALPESHPKARRLARRGVVVWSLPGSRRGEVDLPRLLANLLESGVTSLLVEGGGATHAAFLAAGLVDRVAIFFAPRLLGGELAPSAVAGRGFKLAEAPWLCDLEIEAVGADLYLTGRL
ncbi:MAG: bifunctional diaminohydroxyphosphoribosylaminopyrimidine deaminase/5-amino-6-(5-phosphoribosylamino)uracil reductase RibD [Thermoanaerobaculia bacterium]